MKRYFSINKVCVFFLTVTTSCAQVTNNHQKLSAIVQTELQSGTLIDTAFLNFCFSDSPERFNEKLSQGISSNEIRLTESSKTKKYFLSPDKLIDGLKFFLEPVFRNNTLAELNLGFAPTRNNLAENNFVTVSKFERLLEEKYGPCSFVDSTTSISGQPESRFYWIRGNRKIYFVGMKQKEGMPDFLSLSFIDTRNTKK
jgi:hypothetical protein